MNNRLLHIDEKNCSGFGDKEKSLDRNGVKLLMIKH